ncbi:MAG: NUDIX domain-containing protein, partial [Armatimonadota bacterium]
MAEGTLEATPVVTAFLCRRGRVLLLRRSERVGSYPGRWAGVSGYVERPPLAQARVELREEAGLSCRDAALRGIGLPLLVRDEEVERPWLVFTFLFRLRDGARVRTDWESVGSSWVRPERLGSLDTVPGLAAGLARVWPAWGGPRFWGEMEEVACDTVRGATDLALRGLRAVARVRGANRRRALCAFASLHPSMGVFPHLASRAARRPTRPARLAEELERATRSSARHAARALRDCRRVLTHSASRACREALLMWGRGGGEAVIAESRPKREGVT